MLGLLVRATRKHGAPDAFYLDNGSTLPRGTSSARPCARLGISLLHARPYESTVPRQDGALLAHAREGCLDFLGQLSPSTESTSRLWAFLRPDTRTAPRRRRPPCTRLPRAVRHRRDSVERRPAPPSTLRRRTSDLAGSAGHPTGFETRHGFPPGVLSRSPLPGRDLRAALDRARGQAAAAPSSRRRRQLHNRMHAVPPNQPSTRSHPPKASSIGADSSPSDQRGLSMSAAYLTPTYYRAGPFSKEIGRRRTCYPRQEAGRGIQAYERASLTLQPANPRRKDLRPARFAHKLPAGRASASRIQQRPKTLGRRDFYRQLASPSACPSPPAPRPVFFAVSSPSRPDSDRAPRLPPRRGPPPHQDMLDHLHILLNYQ